MPKLLAHYTNGNYEVALFDDGTKIRKNDLDNLTPSFAESNDITITTRCNGGCKYCYLGCNEQGEHADLNQPFFDTLHKGQEIALNANDLSHPDLESFLERMKKQNVVCNLTINQRHLKEHLQTLREWQMRGLIFGIGISLINSRDDILWTNGLKNTVIHCIDGLLTKEDLENLSNHNLNLLILGYKILGRGREYYQENQQNILNNIEYLQDIITRYGANFRVIAFDNLALEHLKLQSKVSEEQWKANYMGDEGSYTFFIDAVNKKFAVSSLSEKQYDYTPEMTVDDMFKFIQKVRKEE